ncbi:CLUMA_CG018500, isoform A [Clunio marinus]|uniref:CLUMA_CG018500, isoform A n=1 Tax=Clunio marinus TaxID=568069 RepID=A0A1J1J0W2_9DIPT|nr:CLUMA_CG018500, isoform A [Clunio marinus]
MEANVSSMCPKNGPKPVISIPSMCIGVSENSVIIGARCRTVTLQRGGITINYLSSSLILIHHNYGRLFKTLQNI